MEYFVFTHRDNGQISILCWFETPMEAVKKANERNEAYGKNIFKVGAELIDFDRWEKPS